MKQAHRRLYKSLLLTAVLAASGLTAFAQTAATPPATNSPPDHARTARPDPARFQAFVARFQDKLKTQLQLAPAQESAWNSYVQALKPPAQRPPRLDRAEFARLTTPERIDRLRALKAQRDARMTQRTDATKAFYAVLTPEQQKVFDSETLRFLQHAGPGRRGHHPEPAAKG